MYGDNSRISQWPFQSYISRLLYRTTASSKNANVIKKHNFT